VTVSAANPANLAVHSWHAGFVASDVCAGGSWLDAPGWSKERTGTSHYWWLTPFPADHFPRL